MESSESSSKLPPGLRSRLDELFGHIEHEFESLMLENRELRCIIDEQMKKSSKVSPEPSIDEISIDTSRAAVKKHHGSSKEHEKRQGAHKALYAKKLRSQTSKLRAQTTRLLRSSALAVNCLAVGRFRGHRDGVWDVHALHDHLASASADHSAIIWNINTFKPIMEYNGHRGSVNSIRFHPKNDLVLTAGGEGEAHIWRRCPDGQKAGGSSSEELEECESSMPRIDTPSLALKGHGEKVVIAADWMREGEQVVTAGWDRVACLWDAEVGHQIQQLAGHDGALTHIAAHPHCSLVVTSAKDSTFRLWDFREAIHSVSVFQGHQDSVTSAVFTEQTNCLISGSDDRSVRIWDLRQMRTHVKMIRVEASVNRLSVNDRLLAIPLDNRHVRIYDLNAGHVATLPRRHGVGHARMVCAAAWSSVAANFNVDSYEMGSERQLAINLFTCGFDRVTVGWSVLPRATE